MKTKMIMGMAIAAVMTVTSIGALAAETDYSNVAGSQYESVGESTDTGNHGFRKGHGRHKSAKLDEKLASGEITQEEYDAIKAKKESKGAKLDEKLASGEITQEEYDAIKAKKESKGAKLDEKLASGEITQEEYDAIKSAKKEKRDKMPSKGKKSKKDGTTKEAAE